MWGVEYYTEMDGQLAMLHCINEGVLLNYCGNKKDTLIIMPPLIVKKEEIEDIIERLDQAMSNFIKLKKK